MSISSWRSPASDSLASTELLHFAHKTHSGSQSYALTFFLQIKHGKVPINETLLSIVVAAFDGACDKFFSEAWADISPSCAKPACDFASLRARAVYIGGAATAVESHLAERVIAVIGAIHGSLCLPRSIASAACLAVKCAPA